MSNSVQAYMTPSLYQAYMTLSTPYLLFIKNHMILQHKVTLLVLKLLSETHIFSVVFVINCSWMTPSLYQAYMTLSTPYLLFIKNHMILQHKVTLLVLKLLSETHIFSVVFVINCSWRKRYFFYFWKPGLADPAIVLTWQKSKR